MKKSFTFSLITLISLYTHITHPMHSEPIKSSTEIQQGMICLQLIKACQEGDFESVKSLTKSIDVNTLSPYGYTPLYAALACKQFAMAKHLLKNETVDIEFPPNETPLLCAAATGNLPAVKLLVRLGADIEAENKDGYTPLYLAVMNNHFEVVQYLLKQEKPTITITEHYNVRSTGINVKNAAITTPKQQTSNNKNDKNLLHLAIEYGHVDIIKLLLNNKYKNANIEAKIEEKTPLHYAISNHNLPNRTEAVKYLIINGADTKVPASYQAQQDYVYYINGERYLKTSTVTRQGSLFRLCSDSEIDIPKLLFKNRVGGYLRNREYNWLPDRLSSFKASGLFDLGSRSSIKSKINQIRKANKGDFYIWRQKKNKEFYQCILLEIYIPLTITAIIKVAMKTSKMSKNTLTAIGDLRDAVKKKKIKEEIINKAFDGIQGIHKKISSQDLAKFLTDIRIEKQQSPKKSLFKSLDHGYRTLQNKEPNKARIVF